LQWPLSWRIAMRHSRPFLFKRSNGI